MNRIGLLVLALSALVALLAPPAGSASNVPLHVAIRSVMMADARSLAVDVATQGLPEDGGAPAGVMTMTVWLDGTPARASLPLIHMPCRFVMDFDLPAGIVRVGGVSVGTFAPVPPFSENLRFPVEITIQRGIQTATARAEATILLPTVIVPGYLNELAEPDHDLLAAFERLGYRDGGTSPTLFWFRYQSRQVTLEEGGRSLAAYVRHVVLPATHAAKINVVAYSVGGLIARWNIAYDVDGWSSLVNRLVLVGVPNEGAVLAYVGDHAPSFLPFSGWARSPLARSMIPTFPFWHEHERQPWNTPPDGRNALLDQLNARPLPAGLRVYLFYASHDPRNTGGSKTAAGLTGQLPGAALSYEPGDGIVLAASAQGLPVHGSRGVPALAQHAVLRADLGSVYHLSVLTAGGRRIGAALLDRFYSTVDEAARGTGTSSMVTTGVEILSFGLPAHVTQPPARRPPRGE